MLGARFYTMSLDSQIASFKENRRKWFLERQVEETRALQQTSPIANTATAAATPSDDAVLIALASRMEARPRSTAAVGLSNVYVRHCRRRYWPKLKLWMATTRR